MMKALLKMQESELNPEITSEGVPIKVLEPQKAIVDELWKLLHVDPNTKTEYDEQ
jgi:hypothetical protein